MVDNASAGIIVQHGFKMDGGGIGNYDTFNLYEDSSTQDRPIGSRATHEATGRSFRYADFGGTITSGHVLAPDFSDHGLADTDGPIDSTSDLAAATTTILMDNSAFASIAVNQFGGGLMQFTGDDGLGEQYLIKEHTVSANTDEVTFTMYDGKVTAVTTDTDLAIIPPLWRQLVGATLATDAICTGQAPRGHTAAYFGWVQTWGPAVCLADGAVTLGACVYLSDGEAGTVQVAGGGGSAATDIIEPFIGNALYAGDDNGGVGVNLMLFP